MSWLRDKPSEQIRADALAMAAKKLRTGCGPCVDAYVELARRHGATDEEINADLAGERNDEVAERRR